MTQEQIIKSWRSGLTVVQVAREYKKYYNEEAKRRGHSSITTDEAMKHVGPIIYEFETKDWKKGKSYDNKNPIIMQK